MRSLISSVKIGQSLDQCSIINSLLISVFNNPKMKHNVVLRIPCHRIEDPLSDVVKCRNYRKQELNISSVEFDNSSYKVSSVGFVNSDQMKDKVLLYPGQFIENSGYWDLETYLKDLLHHYDNDIFEKPKMIILSPSAPSEEDEHWRGYTIDPNNKIIKYFDSMLGNRSDLEEICKKLGYKLEQVTEQIQNDGTSCGLFVAMFMEIEIRKALGIIDSFPYKSTSELKNNPQAILDYYSNNEKDVKNFAPFVVDDLLSQELICNPIGISSEDRATEVKNHEKRSFLMIKRFEEICNQDKDCVFDAQTEVKPEHIENSIFSLLNGDIRYTTGFRSSSSPSFYQDHQFCYLDYMQDGTPRLMSDFSFKSSQNKDPKDYNISDVRINAALVEDNKKPSIIYTKVLQYNSDQELKDQLDKLLKKLAEYNGKSNIEYGFIPIYDKLSKRFKNIFYDAKTKSISFCETDSNSKDYIAIEEIAKSNQLEYRVENNFKDSSNNSAYESLYYLERKFNQIKNPESQGNLYKTFERINILDMVFKFSVNPYVNYMASHGISLLDSIRESKKNIKIDEAEGQEPHYIVANKDNKYVKVNRSIIPEFRGSVRENGAIQNGISFGSGRNSSSTHDPNNNAEISKNEAKLKQEKKTNIKWLMKAIAIIVFLAAVYLSYRYIKSRKSSGSGRGL